MCLKEIANTLGHGLRYLIFSIFVLILYLFRNEDLINELNNVIPSFNAENMILNYTSTTIVSNKYAYLYFLWIIF